jgi:hypothetical protein
MCGFAVLSVLTGVAGMMLGIGIYGTFDAAMIGGGLGTLIPMNCIIALIAYRDANDNEIPPPGL